MSAGEKHHITAGKKLQSLFRQIHHALALTSHSSVSASICRPISPSAFSPSSNRLNRCAGPRSIPPGRPKRHLSFGHREASAIKDDSADLPLGAHRSPVPRAAAGLRKGRRPRLRPLRAKDN
eukprot:3097166-Rhodomonas_salina.2